MESKEFLIKLENFKDLEVTFANNDALVLNLVKGTKFYGHMEGDILELAYGEHHYGSYGDMGEEVDKSKHYYMSTGTQFFPVSKLKEAIAAFFERMNSDKPYKPSVMIPSYDLVQCLPLDPTQPSVQQRILDNLQRGAL